MEELIDQLVQQRLMLFVRRVVARFIDILLLTVIGYVIISVPALQSLGTLGLLIGIIIVFTYESVFHSRIGKGKSIGKRLLGLQVIQQNGEYLSYPISSIRALPFLIGLFITETVMLLTIEFASVETGFKWIGFTFMILAGIASPLLIFFTRPPQSLADLLVDSLTLPKSLTHRTIAVSNSNARIWQSRVCIFTIAFIPFALLISFFTKEELSQNQDIFSASENIISKYQLPLSGGHFIVDPNSKETVLTFRLKEDPEIKSQSGKTFGEATALTLWTELSQTIPSLFPQKISAIELSYGLNLGIANGTESYRYSFHEGDLDVKEKSDVK